jgi:sugar phosphate isomerase/epimerase
VQHLGYGRQSADQRKYDAAFTSLEHLVVFAKARGVTIALENTPDELGAPASLQHFIAETHLHELKLCFDIGHAHMEDGVESSFDAMRDRIVTTHIHDNHGEKDEHLLPYSGTIDWKAALAGIAGAGAIPLVLEIKEHAVGAPSLDEIRAAADKLENALGK